MLKISLFLLLLFPIFCFGKVYDCFPFFNEMELLKIRLAELDEVVDYFVLVESVETQRGNPKKLYFTENKELFSPYLHKIIHIVIDEQHPEFGLWERENFQRNAILRGLKNCKVDDLILLSDVDEIPRKYLIAHVKEELRRRTALAIGFQHTMYRYHLNRIDQQNPLWNGTIATTYGNMQKYSPQYFRDKRQKLWCFKNAGWHFTWMGGRERIRKKMQSVVEGSDQEFSNETIEAMINSVPAIPLDETFPSYVIEHEEELCKLDFIQKV